MLPKCHTQGDVINMTNVLDLYIYCNSHLAEVSKGGVSFSSLYKGTEIVHSDPNIVDYQRYLYGM